MLWSPAMLLAGALPVAIPSAGSHHAMRHCAALPCDSNLAGLVGCKPGKQIPTLPRECFGPIGWLLMGEGGMSKRSDCGVGWQGIQSAPQTHMIQGVDVAVAFCRQRGSGHRWA